MPSHAGRDGRFMLALGLATLGGIAALGITLPGIPAVRAAPLPEHPGPVPAQTAVAEVLALEALPAQLQPSRSLDPDALPAHLQLAYPMAQPALQLDSWGWRYSESRGRWRLHTGLDLAAEPGTPVLAALPGRVLLVESVSGYGLTVVLDHGAGIHTLYAHLQQAGVEPGGWLERGQVLGGVGMTGATSGPHLHFEVRHRGNELLALDPTPHLPPPLLPELPAQLLATESPLP
jgi:murein DD-endopeptidase MepM/ murein hydrolase activator NlpD